MNEKNAEEIRGFHPVAWGIIIGTFLSRAGFFMTIPFLGIYLGKVKGLDPATIGAILAVSFFVGTFSSFFGGALSDRHGRYPVLIGSMAAWSLVFVGFAEADHTWIFFVLSALNGLFRNVFEPTARALLADVTPDERRTDVFNARYFAINIAGAVGPLAGLKLGISGSSFSTPFFIAAAIFALYSIALLFFMLLFGSAKQKRTSIVTYRQMAKIVFTDRVFLYFLIGNMFVAGAYSHLDTTLSQFFGSRVELYSFLFMVNALSVLAFQYPLTKGMKRFSSLTSLKLGCVLFGMGVLGFGIWDNVFALVLSMVLFTLGEILCFVIGDTVIGEMAPTHLRGAYYGASGFMFVGQSFGAWIGGQLLNLFGMEKGPLVFTILMLLTLSAYPFFQRGQIMWKQSEREVPIKGITSEI